MSPKTAVYMANSLSMEVIEVTGSKLNVYAFCVYCYWADEALDLPSDDLGNMIPGFQDLGEKGRR